MQSKNHQQIVRTKQEIERMIGRIKDTIATLPEEIGFRNILNNFIVDLSSYPDVRCIFDETKEWILHKPEKLEDYLLGMQSLIVFVSDVQRDGIKFLASDVYNENCIIAGKITNQYYIWQSSKSIYWLSYLIVSGIVRLEGDYYIANPTIENDFIY